MGACRSVSLVCGVVWCAGCVCGVCSVWVHSVCGVCAVCVCGCGVCVCIQGDSVSVQGCWVLGVRVCVSVCVCVCVCVCSVRTEIPGERKEKSLLDSHLQYERTQITCGPKEKHLQKTHFQHRRTEILTWKRRRKTCLIPFFFWSNTDVSHHLDLKCSFSPGDSTLLSWHVFFFQGSFTQ